MSKSAPRIGIVTLVIGLVALSMHGVGCYSVSSPAGDNTTHVDLGVTSSSVTARGARVTTRLGTGGQFDLTPSVPQRNVLDVQLFTQAPADSPCSGEVILNAADVGISVRSDATRVHVTVRVVIDRAGSPSPCESGHQIGFFEFTLMSGRVQMATGRLQLSGAALRNVLSNDFSLCLEAEGDFDGTVTISRLVYSFSVSECSVEPEPDECVLSAECESLHEQFEDVAGEMMQMYYSGSGRFSYTLQCRYYSLSVQIHDLDCYCEDEEDEELAFLDGLLEQGVEQMRAFVESTCQPPCPSLLEQMDDLSREMSGILGTGGQLSEADEARYDALYCEYAGLHIQALRVGCFDYSYTPQQVQQAIEQYEAHLEECP